MGHQHIMTVLMDDGTAEGTLKINLATWDCAMYRISRDKLQNYANESDLKTSGIYFLVGEKQEKPAVYVGQANARNNGKGILGRVIEHDKPAEAYWTEALLIYSSSNSLYATELNYLERKCWEKISDEAYTVINAVKPALGNCSPVTKVTMDHFIEGMELMLRLFHYDFFNPAPPPPVISKDMSRMQFFIKRKSNAPGRCVDAVCEIRDSQYVVLKGSLVATVARDAKNRNKYGHDKYADLIDVYGKTTQDIPFAKVSGSSAFVLYGTSNGNVDWKDSSGKSLRDYNK